MQVAFILKGEAFGGGAIIDISPLHANGEFPTKALLPALL